MKIVSHVFDGKGHVFLCELTARELELLTLLPPGEVESVAVGADVAIDPQSPIAQRHLRAQKIAAVEILGAISAADPALRADTDALLAKLEVRAVAAEEALEKP